MVNLGESQIISIIMKYRDISPANTVTSLFRSDCPSVEGDRNGEVLLFSRQPFCRANAGVLVSFTDRDHQSCEFTTAYICTSPCEGSFTSPRIHTMYRYYLSWLLTALLLSCLLQIIIYYYYYNNYRWSQSIDVQHYVKLMSFNLRSPTWNF